jgi:hypothetical protein
MSAVEALLTHVVDYAGLFPPAGLDMESAVRNYQDALAGENGWMLGSFVVPAARLGVFVEAFERVCCSEREEPWTLSVVCVGEGDQRAVEKFQEGAVFIRSLEAKAADRASTEAALSTPANKFAGGPGSLRGLPESRFFYVEFPPERAQEILPVLAAKSGRAKLRTGGLTADAIPPVEAVTGFLLACAARRVPFKATAGLHHPVRGLHLLAPDGAARATMHGFLNVLLAAALAWFGAEEAAVRRTLAEEDATAFHVDDDVIRWHEHAMTADQLEMVRRDFAISFGSCSFAEPVDDLRAMGWL